MERSADLPEVDPKTGHPQDADASVVYRRLGAYKFRICVPEPFGKVAYGAVCFAQVVMAHAGVA